jgi:iron(III) transport system ATP-binding protein
VISPYFGYVMETRLLAGTTLVHLSLKVNKSNFHIHAKIPGLNFFNINEKVFISSDPSQIFVFQQ